MSKALDIANNLSEFDGLAPAIDLSDVTATNVTGTNVTGTNITGTNITSLDTINLGTGGIDFATTGGDALVSYKTGLLDWRLAKASSLSTGVQSTGNVVRYTKIGNMVVIAGFVRTDASGSTAETVQMVENSTSTPAQLPYTPNHNGVIYIGHTRTINEAGMVLSLAFAQNDKTVYLYQNDTVVDYTPDQNNMVVNTQTNIVATFQGVYFTSE